MSITFKKAERKKAKLRLGITGPSGSGKTWGALEIAKGLGGRIAVIDTERGSASLYSHRADFDVLDLDAPYTPERFIAAIKAAEGAGYDVIIIDSMTHEWNGSGGCLDIVEDLARSKFKGNSWAAFNDVTPRHRAFLDAMLQSKCHIIGTMRSKTETAQSESNGKKQVVKLGMKSEQRDGIEYEFTAVLDIVHDGHYATASKDRTGLFGGDPKPITPKTGEAVLAWLEGGADVPDEPKGLESSDIVKFESDVLLINDIVDLKNALSDIWAKATEVGHRALIKAAYDRRKGELEASNADA